MRENSVFDASLGGSKNLQGAVFQNFYLLRTNKFFKNRIFSRDNLKTFNMSAVPYLLKAYGIPLDT
jgi:hypothetical protein